MVIFQCTYLFFGVYTKWFFLVCFVLSKSFPYKGSSKHPGKGPPRDRDDRGAAPRQSGGYDRDCAGTRVSGKERHIVTGI